MKVAVMFSGQGVQTIGMGQDLYNHYKESKAIFEQANAILNWDVKETCFTDSNQLLHQTRYTQGALFTTSMAAFYAFKQGNIPIEAVLGFSLGEYSALVASGVLTFEEGLRLVDKRATYMEACAKESAGAMAAVLGLPQETIKEVCEALFLEGEIIELANDNCPGQVVISGTAVALEKATKLLKEKGAKRVMPLQVSGAFHSSLMTKAANKLKEELSKIDFKEPVFPIVSNVTANYTNKEEIINNIPIQMVKGVRFRESIMRLVEDGFDTFIEVGVKKTLCSFVTKIAKEVRVYAVEDVASLEKVIQELGGDLSC